jgi:hypothetical protein
MRRIYRAKNGVVDGSDFWVADSARPRKGKAKASTARKQEANRNQAVHIYARKLNNNFSRGDLFLTLSFDDRSWRALRSAAYRRMDEADERGSSLQRGSWAKRATREQKRNAILFEAEREGKLLLRRMRDAGAKGMKYSLLAADMDGRTGEEARVHLHLIISGECIEQKNKQMTFCGKELGEFWHFGGVDYEFLRGGSYNALAAYLIRQTRDIKNHKRYVCSRNFEPIEYEEIELGPDAKPLAAPEGAKVEEYQHDPTNKYGMVYMRWIEPERTSTAGPCGKKRRRGG